MSDYIVNTYDEQQQMLSEIGKQTIDDLFSVIPSGVRIGSLNLPDGKSELEVYNSFKKLIKENKSYSHVFMGAGSYNHYIPPVVSKLAGRDEFVTSYTPYQAEMSQGILQTIFEYQTMICELTNMDVSNASVYDGATAAAEAVNMCLDTKHRTVLVASNIHPETIETIKTYFMFGSINLKLINHNGSIDLDDLESNLDESVACVVLQTPNFFGILEDSSKVTELIGNIPLIAIVNPTSLGMVEPPEAHIIVGEGQPLGLPMSFGGPYLGFMATTDKYKRLLPGRVVGQTVDIEGNRAFTLTLQAREQHIRREKATSSICSNQAHCALTSAIYLTSLGPNGLYEVSNSCFQHAHYLNEELSQLGFNQVYNDDFFHEFVTTSPISTDELNTLLSNNDILGPYKLDGDKLLWCATELTTIDTIDNLVSIIKGVL